MSYKARLQPSFSAPVMSVRIGPPLQCFYGQFLFCFSFSIHLKPEELIGRVIMFIATGIYGFRTSDPKAKPKPKLQGHEGEPILEDSPEGTI